MSDQAPTDQTTTAAEDVTQAPPQEEAPTATAATTATTTATMESEEQIPQMNDLSLDDTQAKPAEAAAPVPPPEAAPEEPGVPNVEINGKSYKPLADGDYDAIVLSTGLKECVLAGLLSVRGLRVLQIDRNAYYGGECASLNLSELFEKHGKTYSPQTAPESVFGRSRDYCVDTVPKLLMANGKLVKMLIQTGVTRYMDFNGIAGSYVFNSGKVYKLPVTPTEALTSSLVSLFQKNALRKFADFVRTYQGPKRVADTLTRDEFKAAVESYYATHNPDKVSEADALLERFATQRETLVGALEKKYGVPVFPDAATITFGPGPLGLRIEARPVKKGVPAEQGGPVKVAVTVTALLPGPDGQTPGPAEKSGRVATGDIISHVNGELVLGLGDKEVQGKIVAAPRPLQITFMKPVWDASAQKYDLLRMTMRELYAKFGLDDTTQNFIGHAMALQTDDSYLDKPAEPTVLACQLYGRSMGRYGQDSPYLYPNYGLSSLPEGFSRLSAIHGGCVMLRTDVDEILMDPNGRAAGVRVGDMAARAKYVIGDASYFPEALSRKTGRVIRSVCLLKKPLRGTQGDSAQVILPAKHLHGKKQDVYLSELSASLHVAPKGVFVAIASTAVETGDAADELKEAHALMGEVLQRFDSVSEQFEPVGDGTDNGCYVTASLDASSHFMSAAVDIERIYRAIFGKQLDLDEKIVQDS